MENLLIYIIKVNISLILFYLCYKLVFQRDTFWLLRRMYLLLSILFSFAYPLISVEGWLKKQEPIMTAIASIQLDEFIITPSGVEKVSIFTVENVLWVVFGLIALFLFLRVCVQLFSIIKRRIKGTKEELQGVSIIRMNEKITPFSFFNWIFINPLLHNRSETAEILEHEQTHARQWHSLDVIIGQIQTMLCWFNPAAWLMEREIRINLEFLADHQVLKSGFEPKNYQYHLIKLTYEPADSKLANQFNVSPIKKRIKMMNSKKTKKTGLIKYALIIPVALTVLIVSNMQDMIAASKANAENTTVKESNSVLVSVSEPTVLTNVEFQQPPKKEEPKSKDVESATITVVSENEVNKLEQVTVIGYGTQDNPVLENELKVFEVVEIPPAFPGGDKAMYQWLAQNIKYPVEAQKQKIEGRVIVQFIVDETGKVIFPKVVRRMDPILEAEALRIVSSMPDWIPGKQSGKAVNVRYVLPIQFKLTGPTNSPKQETAKIDMNPLVLLDGETISHERMNEIDPNTIQEINVLKDQASISMYGEKGKNGVILIKLKK
ncbi:MAG: TonB family protein [Paludibacteraceae bacterium]